MAHRFRLLRPGAQESPPYQPDSAGQDAERGNCDIWEREVAVGDHIDRYSRTYPEQFPPLV